MLSDSDLNSEVLDAEPTPDAIAAALAAIPDTVGPDDAEAAAAAAAAPPLPMLEPWATVDVKWLVPLAGKLVQLPYEQAARVTKDECWLVSDDQLELITPALENAVKWVVWRLGAANTISHPLVGLGVALGSMTAIKYGIYQVNQHRQSQGGPRPSPSPNRPVTPMGSSMASGRTEASEGASSFSASQEAANPISSRKEFIVADE